MKFLGALPQVLHSVEGFIAKNNLLCIIELFSFDFLDPPTYTGFASKIIESALFSFLSRRQIASLFELLKTKSMRERDLGA